MRVLYLWMVAATVLPGPVLAANPGSSATLLQVDCTFRKESLSLKKRTIVLPTTGAIVIESHLATAEDQFSKNRLFPVDDQELLDTHKARSCLRLLELPINANCKDAYKDPHVQVWTPPEGKGLFGQGSVGNRRPPVLEEMWSGNMNWTAGSKPNPGTRFLVSRGPKHVVLIMGYETGPDNPGLLLGLQSEVAYYLGVENNDVVEVGRLVDQSASPGPVECVQSTKPLR
jgi:hypothetical protein